MSTYARMPKQIEVKFSLQGAIREDRQTQCFVAYCPTLDLYSAGRSRVEARKALSAAVITYVRNCYERGILGRVLKDKGFYASAAPLQADDRAEEKSQFITIEEHASEYDDVFDFDIPLHLVSKAQSENHECPQ